MKILLSEAQIIHLLKEAYGKEAYIDALLDKMSGQGLSALSPKEKEDLEKMSRGEHIDFGDSESEETPDTTEMPGTTPPAQDLFMELVPHRYQFEVDGETWNFSKEMEPGGGEYDILIVSDEGFIRSFMILPFSTGNEFKVTTSLRDYDFKVKTIPTTERDMRAFIQEFITKDIKQIVKYIKKKE